MITMPNQKEKEDLVKLLQLVRETVERDAQLREKFQVENKFRFITDRLKAILGPLEAETALIQEDHQQIGSHILAHDEVPVYVYLYNAKGAILRHWQHMVTENVFYEYSVNRPIYAEKTRIEEVLRSKPEKAQHAYLTVAIKKSDILSSSSTKDILGNPLLKIREGSLRLQNVISFTHDEQDYVIDEQSNFHKK